MAARDPVTHLVGESYVQCAECGQRFVGGDFHDQMTRWQAHASAALAERRPCGEVLRG